MVDFKLSTGVKSHAELHCTHDNPLLVQTKVGVNDCVASSEDGSSSGQFIV